MEELITIPQKKYEELKMKADLLDDALVQMKFGLEDLRKGRISKFDLEAS